jgi:putative transposase
VVLIVPGQGIKYDSRTRIISMPCLKLSLDAHFLPPLGKVNQVELDHKSAFVTVNISEPPIKHMEHWMGIDLNSTGHIAVVGNPTTGKVQRYGKEALHIHRKYSKMRRHLYIEGHPRVAKNKVKHKGNNKIKDINYKISRAIVNEAAQQARGIIMERLSDIRTTARQSKSSRPALHSWSFYQLQTMMEYKAKLLGVPVAYVAPQYTSQQCSRCGLLGVRNGKSFSCPHCGHVDHADANASFNIALRPSFEESVGRSHADRDVCEGRIDTPQEATL